MTWLGVSLVLKQLFEKTICVIYFTEKISWSDDIGPVNKRRYCVLSILLGLLRDYFAMNQSIKPGTMGYLILWLYHGYNLYSISDLSRKYILGTLMSWFRYHLVTDQRIKADTIC